MTMTKREYKKILTFYKIRIPKRNKTLKKKAEDILAKKLCKCIKSIGMKDEKRSIAICTQSIFKKRGLKRGRFTCKKRAKVQIMN
jgi:hypothetical protein